MSNKQYETIVERSTDIFNEKFNKMIQDGWSPAGEMQAPVGAQTLILAQLFCKEKEEIPDCFYAGKYP